jgi:hypothetical protein
MEGSTQHTEGQKVTVEWEGGYPQREHKTEGFIKESDGGSIIFIGVEGMVFYELVEDENTDATLLRAAKSRSALGSRHGTVKGTVQAVNVEG